MTMDRSLARLPDSPSLALPEDLTYEEWAALVDQLKAVGGELMRRTTYWLFQVGDAVNFGQRKFGEAAARFIDEVGLSYWQVAKYASVARRVPPTSRKATLTFEHHRIVANLSPPDQLEWLGRAERDQLSGRALGDLVRAVGRSEKGKFGPPLNFRELRHEPINEQGVVFLFGMVAREIGFLVEAVATGFPDCRAKRKTPSGRYEEVAIEFEFKASTFKQHRHDPARCDVLVCWENDWPDCPVDVIELREAIRSLPQSVGD